MRASTCPLVRRRWGEGEGEEEDDPLAASISEDGETGLVLVSGRGYCEEGACDLLWQGSTRQGLRYDRP